MRERPLLANLPAGAALLGLALFVGCDRDPPAELASGGTSKPKSAEGGPPPEPPPRLLYLPDGGDIAPPNAPTAAGRDLLPGPWGVGPVGSTRCPAEMVDVAGRFCIDRWEVTLVDAAGGRKLSPHYHPTRRDTANSYGRWLRVRADAPTEEGRTMAVPSPPEWQLREEFAPRAESRPSVLPNGYLDAESAELACRNAGKRLCSADEWKEACRGQKNRKFPYGDRYEQGRCNVFRESHPALVLHGNASINHTDPRLTLVTVGGRPLLRQTGATPECKSEWGADAIYDMVGNLDEWVDDAKGAFHGGFFSRSTRDGCDSRISSHARTYYDYSLGARCCK